MDLLRRAFTGDGADDDDGGALAEPLVPPPPPPREGGAKWTCAACTFSNDAKATKCQLCEASKPVRPPETDSKAPDDFVRDLTRLHAAASGKPIPDSEGAAGAGADAGAGDSKEDLMVRVASLESALQERDETIAVLQQGLRDAAQERNDIVRGLWDKMSVLLANEGRGGSIVRDTVARYSTDLDVRDIERQAKEHAVANVWRRVAAASKERRASWIIQHTWMWREKAQQRVRRRQEVLGLLRLQKHEGMFLSVEEENILRDPTLFNAGDKEFECPICFDDCKLSNILLLECKHSACTGCLQDYAVEQLNHGNAAGMECIVSGCDSKLEFSDVRLALRDKPDQFGRYERFLLEAHLEHDPLMVRCPKPRCQTPMIRRSERTNMCVCPKCNYSFCASCKVEWHADATCEQYKQWKKENAAADDLFEEWRKKNTKPCPGCRSHIQKNGGCNHMTCRKCRHEFCWLCMKKYKSGHFNEAGPCKGKQFT